MAMTRIAALVALTGLALVIAGTVLLFGPWALVGGGVALILAGLVPDWEKGA